MTLQESAWRPGNASYNKPMPPRIGPEPVPPPRSFTEKLLQAVPFGLGVREKPRHFLEMWKTLWENRHAPGYAYTIL
jgi:hypothetical protein